MKPVNESNGRVEDNETKQDDNNKRETSEKNVFQNQWNGAGRTNRRRFA